MQQCGLVARWRKRDGTSLLRLLRSRTSWLWRATDAAVHGVVSKSVARVPLDVRRCPPPQISKRRDPGVRAKHLRSWSQASRLGPRIARTETAVLNGIAKVGRLLGTPKPASVNWYTAFNHCNARPDGETGRRTGLKIPRGESSVTVRFRLRAPIFT